MYELTIAFPYKGKCKRVEKRDAFYFASSAKMMSDTVFNKSRTESKDACSKKTKLEKRSEEQR